MAFRIKDLMINIAPSRKDDAEEPDGDCTGKRTDIAPCEDERSCSGARTDDGGCTGKRTDVPPTCDNERTHIDDCTGRRTNAICISFHSCAGRRTNPEGWGNDPEETLDELKAIKAELLVELAKVNDEIKEVEAGQHPKTLEEVENLEGKLKDALEELNRIKSDLQKK
jgi:uncharacterized protein YdcH (DUF465 family)